METLHYDQLKSYLIDNIDTLGHLKFYTMKTEIMDIIKRKWQFFEKFIDSPQWETEDM